MKLLLVGINSKYIHTCLSIRYLYHYAKKEDSEFCEYTINEPVMGIVADIYRRHADTVFFACYIWNIETVKIIVRELSKVLPQCRIVLGGPEVTYCDTKIIDENPVYAVIRGEGEETYKAFVENGCCAEGVAGMTYRSEETWIRNPDRPLICDISTIPFPYTDRDIETNKGKLIYYESSRGCPFRCSYCLSSTIHGVRYRDFSMVCEELLFFIRHEVPVIKFVDRTFNAGRKRTYDLISFMIDHAAKTTFHFEIAADLITDELEDLLKTAPKGLFQMEIGVQSTNPRTLDAIDRKADFEKISRAVRRLMGLESVHIHLDLIAGLPYEDIHSFEESFNTVMRLEPDVLQLGFLKLLHGTKIREQKDIYAYQYTSVPPYEILSNRFLAYEDVLRLKGIEDVFEKYYNSGVFTHALNYLLRQYESAFMLFDDIASYFRERGYDKISHAQKSLYKILLDFYYTKFQDKRFADLLKYDYFLHNKGGNTPEWSLLPYDSRLIAARFVFLSDADQIKKYLPEFQGWTAKNMIKHVRFEPFLYDVTDTGEKSPNIVVFDYLHNRSFSIHEENI